MPKDKIKNPKNILKKNFKKILIEDEFFFRSYLLESLSPTDVTFGFCKKNSTDDVIFGLEKKMSMMKKILIGKN